MTQAQIEFLYSHKVMYHNFTTSGVIPHLPREDSEKFLEIAKTFQADYNTSLWCGDCIMEMVDFVYKQAAKVEPKKEVVIKSADVTKTQPRIEKRRS